jgi:hypothetical protein
VPGSSRLGGQDYRAVMPGERQQLARHKDVAMTMRYTNIGMQDKARALASLPAPVTPTDEVSQRPSQHSCSPTGQTP